MSSDWNASNVSTTKHISMILVNSHATAAFSLIKIEFYENVIIHFQFSCSISIHSITLFTNWFQ